ncbi:zinc finger CCCH domain-containing protein 12-like isoform X3 [Camellia sinensis]|uniref:zinc finger CCCH domain-containing protein 12-like isoform X3 n=1 Tax=Camellia sinensis TaxID=4442 RepID=UPI001036C9BF|nr:zinc finger CCCH domain-containing protein 12-like isoform X3 [Camellia sinensis]
MDYHRDTEFSGGNVVPVFTGPQSDGGDENWDSGLVDQAVWATEDDYGAWNREASVDTNSNSNYETRSGSEPPNKKSRNSQSGDSRSKAIGKMFFKTKLCCKFRAGTCPYITNCNFAHSIEELRRPPPNWQEIVAAHEEERGVSPEPREEFQIPSLGSTGFTGDSQRSYKGRHCKKFYTEEGCPYGDNCTFLHDEQSKARESVAISLGPGSGGGYGGNGGNSGNSSGSNVKPSNWKTRICNKWEMTGYCPFGNKCHFAHGAQGFEEFVSSVDQLSTCQGVGLGATVKLIYCKLSITGQNTATASSHPRNCIVMVGGLWREMLGILPLLLRT